MGKVIKNRLFNIGRSSDMDIVFNLTKMGYKPKSIHSRSFEYELFRHEDKVKCTCSSCQLKQFTQKNEQDKKDFVRE